MFRSQPTLIYENQDWGTVEYIPETVAADSTNRNASSPAQILRVDTDTRCVAAAMPGLVIHPYSSRNIKRASFDVAGT
jgi:hypothetical protein